MEQKISKSGDHSLGPDIFTGWKPSHTQHQFKQFPIFFTNPPIDKISKSLTTFGVTHTHRVVYMGPRYSSNYKAFKAYSRNPDLEEQHNEQSQLYGEYFPKFQFKFLQQKEKVFPIHSMQYRVFTGTNPTIKKDDLRFDANFQCGNLDLAISVGPNQYDLLMRVDSNTKGHTTWFYFKVENFSSKQKVKFNIINFQKSGLLYKSGLKPYCFRSSKKVWEQLNVDAEYKYKKFRYSQQNSAEPVIKKCLTFSYRFEAEDEYVFLAYCLPYSYSYLMDQVEKLQSQFPTILSVDWNNFSTGGLIIPILSITNPQKRENKQTLLAIGRLHPGETQGSWTIDGFIKYLCSAKASYLRQKLIFKIVPMVNVDGVVLGNFRTSISGRDLNRVFHLPEEYTEVSLIRKMAQKSKPLIFLDFHGHSTKKNVFAYGPNYSVVDRYYLTCRLYPKIISKLTDAFRFYSCIFKISTCKINTARSLILTQHNVAFAYTFEASTFAYGAKDAEVLFNQDEYSKVGRKVCEGLVSFLKILFKMPKKVEEQKLTDQIKNKLILQNQPSVLYKTESNQTVAIQSKIQQKRSQSQNDLQQFQSLGFGQQQQNTFLSEQVQQKLRNELQNQCLSEQMEDQLLKQLMHDMDDEQSMAQETKKEGIGHKRPEQEVSDSDFEEGCDYTDKELKKMMKGHNRSSSPRFISKQKKKGHKKKNTQSPSNSQQNVLKLKKSKHSLTKQKSQQASPIQLSPVKQSPRKGIKNPKVHSISPQITQVNRSAMQSYTSIEELESDPGCIFNKVQYRNWRKFQQQQLSQKRDYSKFFKPQSIKHITLDYNDERGNQLTQMQRFKPQNEVYLRRKIKGSKEMEKIGKVEKVEKIERSKNRDSSPRKDHEAYVKDTILPLLKNSFIGKRSHLSLLDQLLQHSQRLHKNSYGSKNLKIMYL